MTGDEHYKRAESLLEEMRGVSLDATTAQIAQVHATLALAAATAYLQDRGYGTDVAVVEPWD